MHTILSLPLFVFVHGSAKFALTFILQTIYLKYQIQVDSRGNNGANLPTANKASNMLTYFMAFQIILSLLNRHGVQLSHSVPSASVVHRLAQCQPLDTSSAHFATQRNYAPSVMQTMRTNHEPYTTSKTESLTQVTVGTLRASTMLYSRLRHLNQPLRELGEVVNELKALAMSQSNEIPTELLH